MIMADAYEVLAEEVDRIVNSPYPTQLKRLRDIACNECAELDISRWVLAEPCQIDRLATCVLDGLREWPYVLDLMTRLSCNIKIRDAFLRQEPTLLQDIIVQAAKARCVQSRYTAAAVAMLSHPLSGKMTLPSETQTLLVQIFDFAAEQPSTATIKPIYQILKGTSTLLLSLLSSIVLRRFEEHLFNILRNTDQPLSLHCLAIMRIMATANDQYYGLEGSSYDTQELLASTQVTSSRWQPDAIQQFFMESKAQKTMQLVALRASWACTSTTGESFDDRMESLLLANEVISAIPVHLREAWRKANPLVPRKLEGKALAPSLDLGLRFQALCFLLRMTEGGVKPTMAIDDLRGIIAKPSVLTTAVCDGATIDVELLTNTGVLDQNTTTALLQNIVDFTTSSNAQTILERAEPLVALLRELSPAMALQDSVAEGVMLALDVLSCGQKLHSLVRLTMLSPAYMNGNATADVCFCALQSAHNKLAHELSRIFLAAALALPHGTYSVSHQTSSLLLDLLAKSSQHEMLCSHAPVPREATKVAFVEAESTPRPQNVDWRAALDAELHGRARLEYGYLTTLFSKACADLESRCSNVEKPLHDEQQRRQEVEARYEELNRAYSDLEGESIDRNMRITALETERDQYMTDLDASRNEIERLEQVTDELERSLRDARDEIERQATERRRSKDAAELEHAAVLAHKQGDFDDLQSSMRNLREDVDAKIKQLEDLRIELDAANSSKNAAETETDQLNGVMDDLQTEFVVLKKQAEDTTKSKEQLETQLKAVRKDLDAEREVHLGSIERLETETRDRLSEMSNNHESKIAEATKQHEETVDSLKQGLAALQDMSRQAHENHASDIAKRDTDIQEKRKKIDRLNRKCEEKDRHIAEAETMRANLMAAMGINCGLASMSLSHRPSRSTTSQTQQSQFETQVDTAPPTPRTTDEAETQQGAAGGSFASNASSGEVREGPTPKRAKPRKSLRISSPARTRLSVNTASKPLRASTSSRKTPRQPLLSVSANQSRERPAQPRTPLKEVAENLEETTFDGSELFGGTQGDRMMDL